MDPNRKAWNERQKLLGTVLKRKFDHSQALELFLTQHAMVHSPGLGKSGEWSFDEEIWQDLPAAKARRLPPGGEHSIAWMIWHIARCEDITINVLVAESTQVIDDGWMERLNARVYDTGNAMDEVAVGQFSEAIDLAALRDYRMEVGRRTREIVRSLQPGEFQRLVKPAGIQRIKDLGAVVPEASYLLDYWRKQKVSGLMLMPATRHPFVHLNEAMRLKRRR